MNEQPRDDEPWRFQQVDSGALLLTFVPKLRGACQEYRLSEDSGHTRQAMAAIPVEFPEVARRSECLAWSSADATR